jgi:hypothetical protein
MKSKGVSLEDLAVDEAQCAAKLEEVTARQKDLAGIAPTAEEAARFAEWAEKGASADISVLGERTREAEAALAAVEKTVDAFFTPAEDMPLVTEEQDVELPLYERLNPKFAEAIGDFAVKCVKPLCGEDVKTLSRANWKRVKGAFAPYRAWVAAEPVKNAQAKASLEEEERFLRYRMHLGEFLENYCTMERLYSADHVAVFQMGVLRIDGREMNL